MRTHRASDAKLKVRCADRFQCKSPGPAPPPKSDLARDVLKDPYIFDFLGLTENAQERDIARALTQHITRFVLELGVGFAFVGRQYRLACSGRGITTMANNTAVPLSAIFS
jgi:predicted nuclease of restriction endonuclease-like (RecB) superfamily